MVAVLTLSNQQFAHQFTQLMLTGNCRETERSARSAMNWILKCMIDHTIDWIRALHTYQEHALLK